jgi:ABC-type molybdate transport system substrate-binding protein/DNA-binding beta-propeller fold protein YncE
MCNSFKGRSVLTAGAVVFALLSTPPIASASEIKVLCSNGIRAVMEDLVPQFEQATRHTVKITYGLSAALRRQIEGGETFDVAILTPPLIDALIAQGKLAPDTRIALARSAIAIAIRAGATKPQIGTPEALRQTLLAAKSISYASEGAASAFFVSLVQKLNLADALKPTLKTKATGVDVAASVASGEAELGIMPVSEMLTAPGIEVLGALRADEPGYIVLMAGFSPAAARNDAVTGLITFLTAPAALPVIKRHGMEPVARASVPELAFDSVPNFLKLPPGMNFGEVPGVAVNSKGHIFVFTRSNSAGGPAYAPAAAQLLEFAPTGAFVREIGKGLYAWAEAHSVRIDKDDNIWAIDKGSDMVIRFNPAGQVVWVFGRRKESADAETGPWERERNPPLPHVDGMFRQPTDVAWDSDGNIYITDGYVNSRVAKFDKHGMWTKSWGEPGTGPGQFHLPHAIAIDRNDNLYVGDRSNRRIQVFDTNGTFKRMFTIDVPPDPRFPPVYGNMPTGAALAVTIGAPNSICITPGPNQVMFVGESTYPGRIFKVTLDGQVLGVIGRSGRELKQFSGAHALACPSENEIYAAETANWRVQKLLLHQPAATATAARK